jgi:hypothetical protein
MHFSALDGLSFQIDDLTGQEALSEARRRDDKAQKEEFEVIEWPPSLTG